eukprot:scaffold83393_cov35-Prasinocladus_malaysianus.AAC.1
MELTILNADDQSPSLFTAGGSASHVRQKSAVIKTPCRVRQNAVSTYIGHTKMATSISAVQPAGAVEPMTAGRIEARCASSTNPIDSSGTMRCCISSSPVAQYLVYTAAYNLFVTAASA